MTIIDRITFRSLSRDIDFLRRDPVVNAHLYTPRAKAKANLKLLQLQQRRSELLAKYRK